MSQSPENLDEIRRTITAQLASLGVDVGDPARTDLLIALVDSCAYELMALWYVTLRDHAEPEGEAQLQAALGEIGRELERQANSGYDRSILFTAHGVGGDRLVEQVTRLGLYGIKYADHQADRAGQPVDRAFMSVENRALVKQTAYSVENLEEYLASLTLDEFLDSLIGEIRRQAVIADIAL